MTFPKPGITTILNSLLDENCFYDIYDIAASPTPFFHYCKTHQRIVSRFCEPMITGDSEKQLAGTANFKLTSLIILPVGCCQITAAAFKRSYKEATNQLILRNPTSEDCLERWTWSCSKLSTCHFPSCEQVENHADEEIRGLAKAWLPTQEGNGGLRRNKPFLHSPLCNIFFADSEVPAPHWQQSYIFALTRVPRIF